MTSVSILQDIQRHIPVVGDIWSGRYMETIS
jgi:hypothetical protein